MDQPRPSRSELRNWFLVGMLVGLFVIALGSKSPVSVVQALVLLGVVVVAVATVVAVAMEMDPSRSSFLAGTLFGAGAFLAIALPFAGALVVTTGLLAGLVVRYRDGT